MKINYKSHFYQSLVYSCEINYKEIKKKKKLYKISNNKNKSFFFIIIIVTSL